MQSLWSALTVGLLVGCTLDEIDKPRHPDTSRTLSELDAPTGDFGATTPEERATILRQAMEGLELFCGFNPLLLSDCPDGGECERCAAEDALADILTELVWALKGGREDGRGPSIPGVDGLLEIDATCRGWAEPTPDPAHGRVQVTAGFTGRGLDPVSWGNFEQCEERGRKSLVRLNGQFAFTFEPLPVVPFDQLNQLPALLIFDGTVYEANRDRLLRLRTGIRRRLDGTGRREILVETPGNGSFVVTLDQGTVEVIGRAGRVRCDPEGTACVDVAP